MEPDVEALLVNRVGTKREYYLAPIDVCFELVGLLRVHWRGLAGGESVWGEIDRFFFPSSNGIESCVSCRWSQAMPDLNFRVTGVEPAARGLVPLIHFHLEVTNFPETELIQAVMLQAQIQGGRCDHSETAERRRND